MTLIAHIVHKRIGEHTYCVMYPAGQMQQAIEAMCKWCLNPQLNFDERNLVEMAREMEKADQ